MDLTKQFVKYVSQNIFGLLGTSCYILADTYFIAQAAGTDGVTLLNLCLPIYNFIFAIGSMIGLGAATRYAILRAQGDEKAQRYFSNAIFCACILAVPFVLAGIFCPDGLLRLMGGDAGIVALGENYARTMGLNVQRTRTLIFLSTVLLAGTVTAFCGPVGFIGLAVPHLARMLFASADHRILMPGSMLAGAALLLGCDLVAKSLALPINTITALMGIPVVIVVVVRNRNIF